jgi:hypothetical protein
MFDFRDSLGTQIFPVFFFLIKTPRFSCLVFDWSHDFLCRLVLVWHAFFWDVSRRAIPKHCQRKQSWFQVENIWSFVWLKVPLDSERIWLMKGVDPRCLGWTVFLDSLYFCIKIIKRMFGPKGVFLGSSLIKLSSHLDRLLFLVDLLVHWRIFLKIWIHFEGTEFHFHLAYPS